MTEFLLAIQEQLLQEQVQTLVLLEPQGSDDLVEVPTEHLVCEVGQDHTLLVPEQALVLLTECQQGPPGPPGIPGSTGGQALQRMAGETLSALRAVFETPNSTVLLAGHEDAAHVFNLLGITLTAAGAGQPVNVQRSGVIDDGAWSWTPGQRIYLGQGGALVQQPAITGFDVLIGTALSATRLLLNLQDPIELE